MHTTIATTILDYIKVRKAINDTLHVQPIILYLVLHKFATLFSFKARKLDEYFEMEEKLMSKASIDKSLLDFISDPDG